MQLFRLSLILVLTSLTPIASAAVLWQSTLNGADINWVAAAGVDTAAAGGSCPNNTYCWHLDDNEDIYRNSGSTVGFENLSLTFSLSASVNGPDRVKVFYAIDGSTSTWTLLGSYNTGDYAAQVVAVPANASNNSGVSIRFLAESGGGIDNGYVSDVSLSGDAINQPPTVALSNTVTNLSESASTATRVKVADITVTDDALGTETLGLTGDDTALFEIDGTELFLKAGTSLDFETNDKLNVTVTVDDATVGSTPDDTAALEISVSDANEAPTVGLSNTVTNLSESAATTPRIKVADITVTDDALGTETLSVTGADNTLFEIDGTELYLKAGTALSNASNPLLNINVTVDDASVGGNPDDIASLAIAVAADTDAPAYENSTPSMSDVSYGSATFNVQLDEIGTTYYMLTAASSTPSKNDIKTGTGAIGIGPGDFGTISVSSASTNFTKAFSGLSPSTSYRVWYYSEDNAPTPNETSAGSVLFTTTFDIFSTAPSVVNTSYDQTTLRITNTNHAGTIYHMVTLASASNPSTAAVRAGTGAVGSVFGSYVTSASQSEDIDLTGLSPSTAYKVWVVADADGAGLDATFAVPASVSFTTTFDIFSTAPSVVNTSYDQTTLRITNTNHAGTIYHMVTLASATDPTEAQVRSGTGAVGSVFGSYVTSASQSEDIDLTGLSPSTSYKVWVVADSDGAGTDETFATPASVSFTTTFDIFSTAPSVVSTSYDQTTLRITNTNHAGTIYHMVTLASASNPSTAAVRAGTGAVGSVFGSYVTSASQSEDIDLTGLSPSTAYKVWVVADADGAGLDATFAVPASVSFTTTFDIFSTAPSVVNTSYDQTTLRITNTNHAGTIYHMVTLASATNPTEAQVRAGTGAVGSVFGSYVTSEGQSEDVDLTGLSPSTNYKVWVLGDANGAGLDATFATPASVSFTTAFDIFNSAPSLVSTTNSKTTLRVNTKHDGFIYYMLTSTGATPTAADVRSGTGAVDSVFGSYNATVHNTNIDTEINGLTAGTSYLLWVVADADGAGLDETFATPASIAFSTDAIPTAISLSNNSINAVDTTSGLLVGTLSSVDTDSSSFTYNLITSATATTSGSCDSGDSGNGSFQINSDRLETTQTLAADTYVICLSSSDGAYSFKDNFSIIVLSIEESALNTILDFASESSSVAPTESDYENAGVTGINSQILELVNNALTNTTDTEEITNTNEIQNIVDTILAAQDSDGDGLPDIVEGTDETDTDGDGIADKDDLDSDNDGIADNLETGLGTTDSDGDGIIDVLDADVGNDGIVDADKNDANFDGLDDSLDSLEEILAAFGDDTNPDEDSVPNHLDLDSDNDGIPDLIEAGFDDLDGDGLLDEDDEVISDISLLVDTDEDGTANFLDTTSNGIVNDIVVFSAFNFLDDDGDGVIDSDIDADGDGLIDIVDGSLESFGSNVDTDGDGIANHSDDDADNDGISNIEEDPALIFYTGEDIDEDGIDDGVDAEINGEILGVDENEDGIQDDKELLDNDEDGIPDYLDSDEVLIFLTNGLNESSSGSIGIVLVFLFAICSLFRRRLPSAS